MHVLIEPCSLSDVAGCEAAKAKAAQLDGQGLGSADGTERRKRKGEALGGVGKWCCGFPGLGSGGRGQVAVWPAAGGGCAATPVIIGPRVW